MGSESCNSDSNISNSDSNRSNSNSSPSSDNDNKLQEMKCLLKDTKNLKIKRVWAVKKSVSLNDRHVNILGYKKKKINLTKAKKDVFEIKNGFNFNFKHWAIILELSNGSYVNIQYGRNGFSLEEFNETDIKGENLLNSILNTWGKNDAPFSFCNLGNANYNYDKLIEILKKKKKVEQKMFQENEKVNYNLLFRNCHDFVCDIEKILFPNPKIWHHFKYYLDEFFNHFFQKLTLKI